MDISKDKLDIYTNDYTIEVKKKAVKITLPNNQSYIYIKDTHELFDYSLYVTSGVMRMVGYMKLLEDKKYSITFIN
jgi:hypothetical protein